MSDLFDYIYEERSMCNLLCSGEYGDYMLVECLDKRLFKYVYYDNNDINYVVYDFIGDFPENIGDVYVCSIKYNKVGYHFNKYDNFDEIYVMYRKVCDGREYSFIIFPLHLSPTLIDGCEWNVFMCYTINGNKVKMWMNLHNGKSHVDSYKAYM